ncbi:MAG TPA: NADH-quinone oxidoreductase subunit J [Burkholderiaceae bacterium]|nr:NADH-quinone oxidoreductase subunit J [Burkholderiaceae bacterium]
MNGQTTLFLIFSGILLVAALRVITARNPVHAVLFLVLAFFSAACLWMLLQAEFLAIVLVLVYVGAVMVLFLFVVMMLDVNIDRLREGLWRNLWAGGLVAALIVLQMWLVLSQPRWQGLTQPGPGIANANNIQMLGRLTFTEYLFPLQIAGALLLVAIIAAIALTLRGRKDSKHQDPSRQVRVMRGDRVRLVSMPSEGQARQTGVATPAPEATAKQAGET